MMRRTWIDNGDTVALTWQCALAGVSRSAVYARQKPKPIALDDEALKRLIDEEYTRHPFYGSRKMVVYLGRCGHCVNRKRAQRLMRTLGLAGMAPGPNTSRAHPQHQGSTRTCCAAWPSSNPTKFGAPTSLTFAWHAALPTWRR